MRIQILIDNPDSWFLEYVPDIIDDIRVLGHDVSFISRHEDVRRGDLLFIISCTKIIKNSILSRNKHNLVVHESAVPKGRGMSPLTWQILEGKNKVPISLFEAVSECDAGDVYLRDSMVFNGSELVDELRRIQAEKTKDLINMFIKKYPNIVGEKQVGEPTYYHSRKPEDSRLDIDKSIREQFNLLRVVDNDRYPAFFVINGCKYVLKILKKDEDK